MSPGKNSMPNGLKKVVEYLKRGEFKYLYNFAKNKGIKGCIEQLFGCFREFLDRNERIDLPSDKINIMFLPNGGLGDYIIDANYIYHFRKKFESAPINLVIVSKINFLVPTKAVFETKTNCPINRIYDNDHHRFSDQYDLAIDISRYPVIIHSNLERIEKMCPALADYVKLCEKFREEHQEIIDGRPFYDGESSKLCIDMGITRIQQPDIFNYFGIDENYAYPIQMPDKNQVLSKYGLTECDYLTIHRGCDTDYSKDSTKLWPSEHYQRVIDAIKKKYPTIKIVQMGVSHSRCVSFENVDINLIEKTTIDDLKILLKYSKVHIDCEGGMVHLRHAVHGGPSVVIFGPTPIDFYKYSENENISNKGCPIWCEWASSTWIDKCVKGHKEPPCMYATSPERVMESVEKLLG